jgi:alpha-galactosidase
MLPTKIVVIGAGSASFGLNVMASLISSERLRGSHLALVDLNAEKVASVGRLADRLNREWRAEMTITTHTHHTEALEGAAFVVLSVEVPPREALWRSDLEIPLKYGVRQPYAENGGPGGFAHAARNIGPIMQIAHDMERACPQAWLVNFTNPMVRICDAVARYSSIRVVGLCHQIYMGYAMAAKALANDLDFKHADEFVSSHASPSYYGAQGKMMEQAVDRLDIQAAGLNHFTWMLALHDKCTGEDLYPLFAKRWAALDPNFEPLTRRVYDAFGVFPIPGDEHLCEYLPWLSDPITQPWEKYDVSLYEFDLMDEHRSHDHDDIAKMGSGQMSIDHLRQAHSEGALEIIENIAGAGNHYHLAVNLPNRGYVSNLLEGAIVEVPGYVSGAGVQGIGVGALPEPVAELCRRELAVVRLSVDAAVKGDRQAALQCLLLDPVVRDMDVAQQILDDYLETYRDHLPQFWKH